MGAAIEAIGCSGSVLVLGTPAEEMGGGKAELIDKGIFKPVDVAMMVHPCPLDLLHPSFLAIERAVISFRGKNSHAAGAPWDGLNALDAMICLFNNVGLARQGFKPPW